LPFTSTLQLTLPVPGGPYKRTPDRLRNPDENRSLCKRGNYNTKYGM